MWYGLRQKISMHASNVKRLIRRLRSIYRAAADQAARIEKAMVDRPVAQRERDPKNPSSYYR